MRLDLGLSLKRRSSGGGGEAPVVIETVGFAGDSLGSDLASGFRHAQAANFYDLTYDDRVPASSGHHYAVGGWTTTEMAVTGKDGTPSQIESIQADPCDELHIICGRNDGITDNTKADTAFTNITATAEAAITAGVKRVYVWPTTPDNSTNLSRASLEYLHSNLATWAAGEAGIEFMDVFDEWINAAEATNARWNLATDAVGGYSTDNTHGSVRWHQALAPHFETINAALDIDVAGPATGVSSGAYDPTTNAFAYLNGDLADMRGTDGRLNGVANTGVAGTDVFSGPLRWNVNTTNGAVATPTKPSANVQRIAFSGTPTADATIVLQWDGFFGSAPNGGDASRLFVPECSLSLSNVTGLYGIELAGNQLVSFSLAHSTETTSDANRFPDNYTDTLFMRSLRGSTVSTTSPSLILRFYFKSGVAISGSVDVSYLGIVRIV